MATWLAQLQGTHRDRVCKCTLLVNVMLTQGGGQRVRVSVTRYETVWLKACVTSITEAVTVFLWRQRRLRVGRQCCWLKVWQCSSVCGWCDSVADDETVAAVCGWVMEGVTVTLCVTVSV